MLAQQQSETLSILFIEDNPADYRFFQQAFNTSRLKGRYQLSWADSYQSALKMLADRLFDLCFVDYNLGRESGTDLVQEAKNSGQTMPFIMLTHHDRMRYVDQAMDSGIYEYILKREVTPSLLERTIKQALDRYYNEAHLLARKQQNKMEALGQMASGLAHEMNNLLQPILFKAETIIEKTQDKQVIIETAKIVECATKAATIMGDILRFSHHEEDVCARLEKYHAISLIKAKVDFLREMVPKSVHCNVELDEKALNDAYCYVDDTDMFRVLSNLINNAIQAMQYKGQLSIKAGLFQVKAADKAFYGLKMDEPNKTDYIEIIVEDNGPGVAENLSEKIFHPFYTTKQMGEGTGLGLSLVQALIKSWGGSIRLDRQYQTGARFIVLLPTAQSPMSL